MTVRYIHHCEFPEEIFVFDPELRFVCDGCGKVWKQLLTTEYGYKAVRVGIWPFSRTKTVIDYSSSSKKWNGSWLGVTEHEIYEDEDS